MDTRLYPSFGSPLAEHRLCHEFDGPKESFDKAESDKEKAAKEKEKVTKDTELKLKEAKLKQQLKELQQELAKGDKIGKEAKEKKGQTEQERKLIQDLIVNLRNADPTIVKSIADQMQIKDLVSQFENIFLTNIETAEARKTLFEALNRVQSNGVLPSFLADGDQGILKFATNIVQSQGVQNALDGLRERGINIPAEPLIRMLFGGIRGFVANLLATSKFFNSSPELRERGRQMHYRAALEAFHRAELQRNGGTQPTLADLVASPNEQLEKLLLGPSAGDVVKRWNELYTLWRGRAQQLRAKSSGADTGPIPSIQDALTDESAKKYRASIGTLNDADKKAADDAAKKAKDGKDKADKEKAEKEKLAKEFGLPAVEKAVKTYNERPSLERLAQLTIEGPTEDGIIIVARPVEEFTQDMIVAAAARPKETVELIDEGGVRFSGLNQKASQALMKALVPSS